MATQWTKTVDSGLFTFVVGPEGKEFTIHSGAVLHLSPYFETLINGSMKEAQDRRVIWDDIDEETFVTFSQFAYAGHYDTPDHPTSPPEPEETGEARSSYINRSEIFDSSCGRLRRTVTEWEQDFRDFRHAYLPAIEKFQRRPQPQRKLFPYTRQAICPSRPLLHRYS
ncbi:hypothetical protein DL771_002310 [Monosporascus sp. 5C6A]|nr:hypothetical protein DL771_002310 [Monosporascus sp. 5C6A]